jgi:beta-phosphoglucomutase
MIQNTNKIEAIIFDMDGVIITTSSLHENAWRKTGAAFGLTWPSKVNFQKEIFGTVSSDSATLLFGSGDSMPRIDKLITVKDMVYEEMLFDQVSEIVVPGFVAFIQQLKVAGLKVALATSSRPEEAAFVLNSLNISSYFDVVVDISQVTHAKPHPEIYNTVCSKLNLLPSQCLAFEDSVSGIRSVTGAGIPCILVKTSFDEERIAAHELVCAGAVNNFLPSEIFNLRKEFGLTAVHLPVS